MENLSDEQLVEKYLQGDKNALEFLISRYLKVVYNFAYHYAGNSADAEDITQDAFLKVWKNIRKFDSQKKFKNWIFEITKNTAIDLSRKKKIIPFSCFEGENGDNFLIETLRDKNPLPLEICEKKYLSSQLANSFNNVSSKGKEVIVMHLDEDLTFKEIADILGESINTIKSRYRRAILELKKQYSN
ncbi:MAG: RNA polymerase sigma factor [Candidatus Paceibacterota bacterium]